MDSRWNADRRLEEEVAYVGDLPHDEQVPPLEDNANVDQVLAYPPPMTEAEMTAIHVQMSKAMTTQSQAQRLNSKL